MLKESFTKYDISLEDINNMYDLYKKSYEKSTGKAWNRQEFNIRTDNWDFFGDEKGYVAARPQSDGLYKLTIVAGDTRSILKGIKELLSLNKPVWGMVSKDILPMTNKLGFKTPSKLLIKTILKFIPKESFGDVDFDVNSDGSITLKYEDLGNATKYFIANKEYFNFLKQKIKDKINPLKLTNILKEIINEAKQVGNLYHFTALSSIIPMLNSQYIIPNWDGEGQISTTRKPDMDTTILTKIDEDGKNIARLMLDGNKISNKYKIRPFAYDAQEDVEEEQIVVNGKNFHFLPYLKRIDIFIVKELKSNKNLDKTIDLLEKMNIPYKIYKGFPTSNIPYTQSKEGNPSNIKYTSITNLPDNTKISGNLDFRNVPIKKLPKNLQVKGNLDLRNVPINELPEGLQVKGKLNLENNRITKLPNDLKVKDLTIVNTLINELPEGLQVKGSLIISNNVSIKLPNNLNLEFLNIWRTPIKNLPDNLTVGSLMLNDTLIKKLPSTLKCKKLYIGDIELSRISYLETIIISRTRFEKYNSDKELIKKLTGAKEVSVYGDK